MPFLEIITINNISNYIRFIGVKRKKKQTTQQKHLSVSTNDNTSH